MAQFVHSIEGMAEACKALDMPIVSGNVSLYNETKAEDGSSKAILPTPAIGGIGLIDDIDKMMTIGFKNEGDKIWLFGGEVADLGQSLWLREIHGLKTGNAPVVDLELVRKRGESVRWFIETGKVNSVHDISDGGLLIALAEMALSGGIGLRARNRSRCCNSVWRNTGMLYPDCSEWRVSRKCNIDRHGRRK